jgi:hypothetical protein
MLSRRDVIGKMAVGAAAAVVVGAARTGTAATRPLRDATDEGPGLRNPADAPAGEQVDQNALAPHTDAVVPSSPPPWDLVAPLAAGSVVAHGWRLVDVTPVRHGSAVVTLANERGRSHRVHLCRNDGNPQGLVYTRRVDLVVMNQGYGELPTEEHFGQAVAALAHAIAANETTVPGQVFADLVPHAERVQRYAALPDGIEADGKLR